MLAIDPQFGLSICHRIGVVYAQKGQTKEEEFFNNPPSLPFIEFLNLIGENIELKGWSGYNGDMNSEEVDNAYYTKWRNFEIMFHVATFLTTEQQRRLVGNDKVLIYFQEEPFPAKFRGQVNSLGLTVQPHTTPGYFMLGGYMINSLNLVGSNIPNVPVSSAHLKDILLSTAINGITSCINSPPLSSFVLQVRERHLQETVDYYLNN
eukprot:gnl/Spiro4/23896_TR11829_c0_g3_i1.p1 gnl/Spiro4/23896_TR11829_c0_g3~~gnl/Spiro4/23896_TR11829_c0_g3_i1.p1  ORF type:complete len:222 (-),score=33.19 gnl/Spiro4/23896_TR11829_c0_g3_i1:178-798(-)